MESAKPKMKLTATLVVLAFFIIIDTVAFYSAYQNRMAKYKPIDLAAPAPDFEWQDFDGKKHKFKELAGKVVVLHFWATWCPPCRDEFPKLIKAAGENKDVIFLTITSDEDLSKAKHFVAMSPAVAGIKPSANVLFAWDPNKAVTYDEFLTVVYPESIIVDGKQNMRRKFPLPVEWNSPEIHQYLEGLKAGK